MYDSLLTRGVVVKMPSLDATHTRARSCSSKSNIFETKLKFLKIRKITCFYNNRTYNMSTAVHRDNNSGRSDAKYVKRGRHMDITRDNFS